MWFQQSGLRYKLLAKNHIKHTTFYRIKEASKIYSIFFKQLFKQSRHTFIYYLASVKLSSFNKLKIGLSRPFIIF